MDRNRTDQQRIDGRPDDSRTTLGEALALVAARLFGMVGGAIVATLGGVLWAARNASPVPSTDLERAWGALFLFGLMLAIVTIAAAIGAVAGPTLVLWFRPWRKRASTAAVLAGLDVLVALVAVVLTTEVGGGFPLVWLGAVLAWVVTPAIARLMATFPSNDPARRLPSSWSWGLGRLREPSGDPDLLAAVRRW